MLRKSPSLIIIAFMLLVVFADNPNDRPFASDKIANPYRERFDSTSGVETKTEFRGNAEGTSIIEQEPKQLPGYEGTNGGFGSDDTDLSSVVYYFDGSRENVTYNVSNKTLVQTSIADNFDQVTNLTLSVDSVTFPRNNHTVQDGDGLKDKTDMTTTTAMEFRVRNASVLYGALVNLTVSTPGASNLNVSIYNAVNVSGAACPFKMLRSQNINISFFTGGEMYLGIKPTYLNISNTFQPDDRSYSFFLALQYPDSEYEWLFEPDVEGEDNGAAYQGGNPHWEPYAVDLALKVDTNFYLTPFEAMIAVNSTRLDKTNVTQDLVVRSTAAAYNLTSPFPSPNMTVTTFATSCNVSSVTHSYLVHPSHNNVTWTIDVDVHNVFRNGATQNFTVFQVPTNWTVLYVEIDGETASQGDGYSLSLTIGAERNLTCYNTNSSIFVEFETANLITSSLNLYVLEGTVWTSGNICYAGTVNKNGTGLGGQSGDSVNMTSSLGLTTGNANVSLFDTDGVILGDTSFGNYVDTTNNSWNIGLSADGRISVQTSVDPNVTLGAWAWRLQWCNGTQAGVAEAVLNVRGVSETQLVAPVGNVACIVNDPSIQIEVAVLDRTHNLDLGTSFEANWAFSTEGMTGSTTNTTHFIHSASLSLSHTVVTDGTYTVTVLISQANFVDIQYEFDVTIYHRGKADFASAGGPFYFGMEYQLDFALINQTSGPDVNAYNVSQIDVTVTTAFDYSLDFNVTDRFFVISIDTSSVRATQSHSIVIQMQYGCLRSDVATPIMQDEVNVFVNEVPTTLLSDAPASTWHFTNTIILFSYRDDQSLLNISQAECSFSNGFNLTTDQYAASWQIDAQGQELTLQIIDPTVNGVNITVGFSKWGHENHTESFAIRVDDITTEATTEGDPTDVTMHYGTAIDVEWKNTLNGSRVPEILTVNAQTMYNASLLYVSWEYTSETGTLTLNVRALCLSEQGSTLNVTLSQSGFENASISIQINVVLIETQAIPYSAGNIHNTTANPGDGMVVFYFQLQDIEHLSLVVNPTGELHEWNCPWMPEITASGSTAIRVAIVLDSTQGNVSLTITLTLGKDGYSSQYLTLHIQVGPIQSTTADHNAPSTVYFAHETSFFATFIANGSELSGYNYVVTTNCSDFVTLTLGLYDSVLSVEFTISYSGSANCLNMTILLSKQGYLNSTVIIIFDVQLAPISTSDVDEDVFMHHENEVIVPIADGINGSAIPSGYLEFELQYDTTKADVSWEYLEDSGQLVLTITPKVTQVQALEITIQITGIPYESAQVTVNAQMKLSPTTLNWLVNGSTTIGVQENTTIFMFRIHDGINTTNLYLDEYLLSFNGSMQALLAYEANGYTLTISVSNLDAGQTLRVELLLGAPGYTNQSFYIDIIILPLEEYTLDVDCQGDLIWNSTLIVTVTMELNQSSTSMPLSLLPRFALNPNGIHINATAWFVLENGTIVRMTQIDNLGDLYQVTFNFIVPLHSTEVSVTVSAQGLGMKVAVKHVEPLSLSDKKATSDTPWTDRVSPLGWIGIVLLLIGFISGWAWFVIRYRRSREQLALYDALVGFEPDPSAVPRLIDQIESLSMLLVVDTESGLPVFSHGIKDSNSDDILISGFLQAISAFGQELAGEVEIVKEISYRNFSINSCIAGRYGIYLVSHLRLGSEMKDGLESFSNWLTSEFDLEADDGGMDYDVNRDGVQVFASNDDCVVQAVHLHLFSWVTLPLFLLEEVFDSQRGDVENQILQIVVSRGSAKLSDLVEELGNDYDAATVIMNTATLVRDGILVVDSDGFSDASSDLTALPEQLT